MKDLKESFKIITDENLKETIINSGKKLNWKPISISDNEVEFQYTTHLTKFYTVVSWTVDGFINLSSNYKKKSIKVDLGGYRNNNNEKIKLSILREVELKTKDDVPNDIVNNDKLKSSNSTDNIENEDKININNNKKENYSELISQKNNSQNKVIKIALIVFVVLIGFLVFKIGVSNNVSVCECKDNFWDLKDKKYGDVMVWENTGNLAGTNVTQRKNMLNHYNAMVSYKDLSSSDKKLRKSCLNKFPLETEVMSSNCN